MENKNIVIESELEHTTETSKSNLVTIVHNLNKLNTCQEEFMYKRRNGDDEDIDIYSVLHVQKQILNQYKQVTEQLCLLLGIGFNE